MSELANDNTTAGEGLASYGVCTAKKSYTPADYAKAQVALLPLISRTVKYKQNALEEVEVAAQKHEVPVSDLIAWFQAATSL